VKHYLILCYSGSKSSKSGTIQSNQSISSEKDQHSEVASEWVTR